MMKEPLVPQPAPFDRLVITGAGGRLGTLLAPRLAGVARELRLVDRCDFAHCGAARVYRAELGDLAGMVEALRGADAVLHLGGASKEADFETICDANMRGTFNVYEAARIVGVRRVVYASSHHVTGFYPAETLIGPDAPNRPDSLYGASKCFGEAIARLFWDKFGIESAVIRIGSCQPRPKDARMLATWISEDDLAALFTRALLAPELGYRVIFGASDNSRSWWRNPEAEAIGWTPKDSADVFAASVADVAPAPHDRYQGGVFTRLLHFPPP